MARSQLRFSGWHIPFEHRNKHPCWEFALDEEGLEGQDETTMRPCAEPSITQATDVVTASAIAASGETFPAVLSLDSDREFFNGLMIYVDRKFDGRVVELVGNMDGKWTEYRSKPSWYSAWTSALSEPGLLPVLITALASHNRTIVPSSFSVTDVSLR